MKITLLPSLIIAVLSAYSANASVILIDFGSQNAGFQSTGNWNNIATITGKSPMNKTINDLIDDAGTLTGFTLNTFAATVGANEIGTTTTTTGFPSTATRDTLYIEGTESVTIAFSNLEAGQSYDFTFYAARSGIAQERTANYEVIGGNKTDNTQLNASGNIDSTVTLAGFTPDVSNEISIQFTRVTGSFAYLGVIEMESSAIPEPAHFGLVIGAIGIAMALRRRKKD